MQFNPPSEPLTSVRADLARLINYAFSPKIYQRHIRDITRHQVERAELAATCRQLVPVVLIRRRRRRVLTTRRRSRGECVYVGASSNQARVRLVEKSRVTSRLAQWAARGRAISVILEDQVSLRFGERAGAKIAATNRRSQFVKSERERKRSERERVKRREGRKEREKKANYVAKLTTRETGLQI